MCESSSSEEENVCFEEAIDPTFFTNELFQSTKSIDETEKKVQLPPSRRIKQHMFGFNPLEIRATPEFRSYVSKHLHKLLDQRIDDTEKLKVNKKRRLECKNENKGVKLLRTSIGFLSASQKTDMPQKRHLRKNKRRKIDNESSSDEEKRAKEAAVTAEWIISGKATEGWVPCTKGKVEVVIKAYHK